MLPVYVCWLVVKCMLKCCSRVDHIAPSCMQHTLYGSQYVSSFAKEAQEQSETMTMRLRLPLAFLCCHLCTKETVDPLHQPIPHRI